MTAYVRPSIASRTFVDATGQVIPYGSRWAGSPPDDAYSATSNLERFEPLHTIAHALIDWLVAEYDVTLEDDLAVASDLNHTQDGFVRAVRLTPAGRTAAPLTFVFTSFPGVFVHAGLFQDFHYPPCGCDACDDGWEATADSLEELVLAVAAGGLTEFLTDGDGIDVSFRLELANGWSSGSSGRAADYPAHRVAMLRAHPGGRVQWPAWPTRRQEVRTHG